MDWLIELVENPEHRALLAVPISAVLAILVDLFWKVLLRRVASQTTSDLDDRAITLLRHPTAITIFLIGLGYAAANTFTSISTLLISRSILLSAAVFIWTAVAMRAVGLVLEHLTLNQDRYAVVQPRTLPIFYISGRFLVLVGSVYFLLLAWRINVTAWIASAGIVGIAVAYAAQDTLSSLLSGVAILTDAPYKLNDFLILDSGLKGRVTYIGFRSTRLLTLDDVEVVIPNAVMATSTITNMSGGPHVHTRIELPVGVAYGADIDRVRAILHDVARRLDHVVLDKAAIMPQVHFVRMGGSSLDFQLRVWLDDPASVETVTDQANTLIYQALNAADIEIPYAKHDVYLHAADGEGA